VWTGLKDAVGLIKFIITVKFNISTRKCKTNTGDKHKHCTMRTFIKKRKEVILSRQKLKKTTF